MDEDDEYTEDGAVSDLVHDGVPEPRARHIATEGARVGSELVAIALGGLNVDEPITMLSLVNAVDALDEDQLRSALITSSIMLAGEVIDPQHASVTIVLGAPA